MKYAELKSPLTVQFELTLNCPNRCCFCYNFDREQKKNSQRLDDQKYVAIVDKLMEADVFEIVFTGGEPLLRKKILFTMLEKLRGTNIESKLNSNLVLLMEEDAARLRDSGISTVMTTVMSHDEKIHNQIVGADRHSKTLRGLSAAVRAGIVSGVNMVAMERNKSQVYETGKFLCENYGISFFCATPLSPCYSTHVNLELSPGDIASVLDQLEKVAAEFDIPVDVVEPLPLCIFPHPEKYARFLRRDCGAGRTTVAVSPAGDVKACTHTTKAYGNLLEDSLENIWKEMAEWRDGSLTPTKCSGCAAEINCSTGCRQAALVHYGDLQKEDPLTSGFKALSAGLKTDNFMSGQFYRVNPALRYREEKEGYILSVQGSFAYVNKALFQYVKALAGESNFRLNDAEVFYPLIAGGVLVPSRYE